MLPIERLGSTAASVIACAAAVCCTSCVGPHTTLQTARALEPGQFQVVAGASVPVHTTFSRALVENVTNAVRRARTEPGAPLSPEEQGDAIEAALAAVLLQPSLVPEASVRLGVLPRLDLGLRYGGPSYKFDAKYQWLADADFDGALSLGYVYHASLGARVAGGLFGLFDTLRLVDYSRHDLDAALILSTQHERPFIAYGALRYLLGSARLDVSFPAGVLPGEVAEQAGPRSVLHYFLGTGGVRVGTRHVAVLLELSLGWLAFDAQVLGDARDLSGFVVTPAAGLDVRF